MPRVVNHDARRRDIVEALLTVAARDGLPAATSRAVANEIGIATGALWHYFPTFDALLSAAFTAVFVRSNDRIDNATRWLSGLPALRAMMGEVLPTNAETQDEARLVVGFWGRVAIDKALAHHQVDFDEVWRQRLLNFLDEAVADGELPTNAPRESIADQLMVLAAGQQVAFVVGSPLGLPSRQLELVETILQPW